MTTKVKLIGLACILSLLTAALSTYSYYSEQKLLNK